MLINKKNINYVNKYGKNSSFWYIIKKNNSNTQISDMEPTNINCLLIKKWNK